MNNNFRFKFYGIVLMIAGLSIIITSIYAIENSFANATDMFQIISSLQLLALFFSLLVYVLCTLIRSSDDDNDKGKPVFNFFKQLSLNLVHSYALVIFVFQVHISINSIKGINLITDASILYNFTMMLGALHFLILLISDIKKKNILNNLKFINFTNFFFCFIIKRQN